MLVRALNQHAGGWRAAMLTDPPGLGALAIVDFDEPGARRDALDTLRPTAALAVPS